MSCGKPQDFQYPLRIVTLCGLLPDAETPDASVFQYPLRIVTLCGRLGNFVALRLVNIFQYPLRIVTLCGCEISAVTHRR